MSTSAAPLQFIAGGVVKIAWSSMYSQFAVNCRRDTTCASVTSSGRLVVDDDHRLAAREPGRIAQRAPASRRSGTIERSSPRPVAWS